MARSVLCSIVYIICCFEQVYLTACFRINRQRTNRGSDHGGKQSAESSDGASSTERSLLNSTRSAKSTNLPLKSVYDSNITGESVKSANASAYAMADEGLDGRAPQSAVEQSSNSSGAITGKDSSSSAGDEDLRQASQHIADKYKTVSVIILVSFCIVVGCVICVAAMYLFLAQESEESDESGSEHDAEKEACEEDRAVDWHWRLMDEASIEADIQRIKGPDLDIISPHWTTESVSRVLQEHGVLDGWTEQSISSLARDLSNDKARLVLRGSKLVHEVDLCMVFLVYAPDGLVVQELSHPAYQQDIGDKPERVPRARMLNGESLQQATWRCLMEKLEISREFVQVSPKLFHVTEAEGFHDDLPGLRCIDRKYYVTATMKTTNIFELNGYGLPHGRLDLKGYRYSWKRINHCKNLTKHCRNQLLQHTAGTSPLQPAKASRSKLVDCDCLVLPWTENDVLQILERYQIQSTESMFGRTLADLVRLLREGRLSLAVDRSAEELLCLEEAVVCLIRSPKGVVSLGASEAGGAQTFPKAIKFSGESAWRAALRFLHHQLKLSQPALRLNYEAYSECHSVEVQITRPNSTARDFGTAKSRVRMVLLEGEVQLGS